MKTQIKSQQLTGRTRGVLAVIFLISAIGLAYEITLTRVFSVILQYQSVYLIVSLSIMGLSVGAGLGMGICVGLTTFAATRAMTPRCA